MSDGPRQQLARLAAFADADTEGGAEDLFADPRWQELAAGTASPETVAELEALAEAAGMPEAMKLFAPLPEEARERVERAAERAWGAVGDGEPEPAPEAVTSIAPGGVTRTPAVVGLVAALAVAAALALWFRGEPEPVSNRWPSYEMTVEGGQREMRTADEPRRFRPGSSVTILLRPEERIDAAPGVRAYLRGADGVRPLAGRLVVAASGSIRFEAELPSTLPAEPLRLLLVVGDADVLPARDADAGALDVLSPAVRVLEASLPLVDEGSSP